MNRRMMFGFVLILLAAVAVSPLALDWLKGTTAKHDKPVLEDGGASASSVEATANACNGFALDLYARYSVGDGNILFSPYSISTALSMTYEGARGETADEMRSVFGFIEDNGERRSANARIFNVLNGVDREYELHTVNALWVQQDYPVREEYIEAIADYYGGESNALDFVGEPEDSRVVINDWVEERTNDRIKDLFPYGSIHSDVRLVLTNAIYFKGDWLKEFDEDDTSVEEFHVRPTDDVNVDMMRLTGERFNYTEEDRVQLLELPYAGGDVSMIILLPEEIGLDRVEAELSTEKLGEWIRGLEETVVDVHLPRFTFESKYDMGEYLADMGMPTAFTDSADFTGITEADKLCIDKVIHQAFIEVNEKGTEAAAATGVSITLTSAPVNEEVFHADRPFIFVIRDRVTGVILFMGRVTDPSG
ncbi:serpin family protein [Candidatus Bathyarchaeota archaeon]|nr:serpin family protein [Candidatus Bathyarchaeota archaeon]